MRISLKKISLFSIYWKILICIFSIGLVYLILTKLILINEINIDLFVKNLIFLAIVLLFPVFILLRYNTHIGSISPISKYNSIFVKIFFIFFLLSFSYTLIAPFKSILFIMLFIVLFLLIFIQIVTSNLRQPLIIFELTITFLLIIYSVTLKYPLYYGATDILLHLDYSKLILALGHTPPLNYQSSYTFYPLTHFITVISSEIFNINIEPAFYVTTGLIFSFSILFLYGLFRLITTQKIALVACLLYSSTAIIIFYGLYMTPRSMAYILYLILLFLVVKMNFGNMDKNKNNYFMLSVLICLSLVFVHHASNFQIIPIFLLFFIILDFCYIIRKTEKKLIVYPILIFGVFILIHWFYIAQQLSVTFIQYARSVFESDAIGLGSTYIQPSLDIQKNIIEETISYLVTYVPISILLFFVFLGIGLIFKQNANKKLLVFGILAFLSTPFWAPTSFKILNIFQGFVLERIILFTAPFIMLIFGYGLYQVILHINGKKNKSTMAIIFILLFSYILVSLGNVPFYDYKINFMNNTNSDSYSFNEKDLNFMNFTDRFIPSGSLIITDFWVVRYYTGKTYFSGIEDYDIKYYQRKYLGNLEDLESQKGFIIFRKEYFENKKYLKTSDKDDILLESKHLFEEKFFNFNKIYSSQADIIYLT